jgi:hypothetical protein
MRVAHPTHHQHSRRTILTTTENSTDAQREETRRAAFLALVTAQDEGNTVKTSRELIARRFGLREEHVRAIEREGMTHQWPPLGADAG